MPSPVPLSADTTPQADERMIEAYRAMADLERLRKAGRLAALANSIARADLRQRHPDASPRELRLRLAARTCDQATMIRAFGWDPDANGV